MTRIRLSRPFLLLAVVVSAQLLAVSTVSAATPTSGPVGPANNSSYEGPTDGDAGGDVRRIADHGLVHVAPAERDARPGHRNV